MLHDQIVIGLCISDSAMRTMRASRQILLYLIILYHVSNTYYLYEQYPPFSCSFLIVGYEVFPEHFVVKSFQFLVIEHALLFL
jgi:hypothetical protein